MSRSGNLIKNYHYIAPIQYFEMPSAEVRWNTRLLSYMISSQSLNSSSAANNHTFLASPFLDFQFCFLYSGITPCLRQFLSQVSQFGLYSKHFMISLFDVLFPIFFLYLLHSKYLQQRFRIRKVNINLALKRKTF